MERFSKELAQSHRFLDGVRFHADAILAGEEAIRHRLADLKIDRWLCTEHSDEASDQLQCIEDSIETLERILTPSPFDPEPDPQAFVSQIVVVKLARAVLERCADDPEATTWIAVIQKAKGFLETHEGRSEAASYIVPQLERGGVLLDDVPLITQQAATYIERYLRDLPK